MIEALPLCSFQKSESQVKARVEIEKRELLFPLYFIFFGI